MVTTKCADAYYQYSLINAFSVNPRITNIIKIKYYYIEKTQRQSIFATLGILKMHFTLYVEDINYRR